MSHRDVKQRCQEKWIPGIVSFALLLALTSISPGSVEAQTGRQHVAQGSRARRVKVSRPRRVDVRGISTERLKSRDYLRWAQIRQSLDRTVCEGQRAYPILLDLWNWIQASGHTVYIELPAATSFVNSVAGNFRIERHDPTGKRHIAVIRLFLRTIDQAVTNRRAARPDGFIPFADLRKEDRYLEVLGHEMAHAVYILSDPQRAAKSEALVEHTNERLLSTVARKGSISPELSLRLDERDLFLEEVERHAEEVEFLVWQELRFQSRGYHR